jgi:cell division protein FtsL
MVILGTILLTLLILTLLTLATFYLVCKYQIYTEARKTRQKNQHGLNEMSRSRETLGAPPPYSGHGSEA